MRIGATTSKDAIELVGSSFDGGMSLAKAGIISSR